MRRLNSVVPTLLTLAAVLALPSLVACGQKGPLSLPAPAAAPATAASGPVR